ncbi:MULTISPECIES: hypothetical protein [unclassified Bradyrhizobium]
MSDHDSFRGAWEEAVKMYREQKAENDRLRAEMSDEFEYLKTSNQILNDLMDKRDDEITRVRADLATMNDNHRAMAKLLGDTGRELERLKTFVRQVANCDLSDNQNIRRARELCADLSPASAGGEK